MLLFSSLNASHSTTPHYPRKQRYLLASSPRRPHVKAPDRFLNWSTPHSDRQCATNVATYSRESHDRLLHVALASLAPDTKKTYAAGLLRFNQFCDNHNVPEDARMPASGNLLAMFLSESAAGNVTDDCSRNWLAGLHFWHNIHDAEWHGDSDQVRSITKGVKKMVPISSRRPPRAPVTMRHMYALRERLSTSNSYDVAVLALAEATFWGTCRLGETAPPGGNNFDPAYHVTKGTQIISKMTRDGIPYISFHIPWSKTTGFLGADIILTTRDDFSNPTQSFLWHRVVNASVPDHAPLFSYETDCNGGWSPLTRDAFLKTCNEIWESVGLESVLGHSFRIGSATEHLLQGIAPVIVQRHGRWKTQESFMRYWRKIDNILPTFFSSRDPDLISRLRVSMDCFISSK